ncbi:MAG: hypothetical protein V4857_17910 [Pseudomonadota bacterium]
MTIEFDPARLAQFHAIPFGHQRFAQAKAPQAWVDSLALEGANFDIALPAVVQSREEVRALCRNPAYPLMYRYICAMAWGNQGAGKGGGNARRAWEQRDRLVVILQRLVGGATSRNEAYTLFCGAGRVAGLGPSYFTKLLFFFWPDETCYIMDRWTAASMNYLCRRKLVPMSTEHITARKDGVCYELYCQAVEQLAVMPDGGAPLTGEQTEMRLFCRGGKPPGPWRAIVKGAQ